MFNWLTDNSSNTDINLLKETHVAAKRLMMMNTITNCDKRHEQDDGRQEDEDGDESDEDFDDEDGVGDHLIA